MLKSAFSEQLGAVIYMPASARGGHQATGVPTSIDKEMLDYRQLSVACHFGSASKDDIEAFIQSFVDSGEDYDSRIFDAHASEVRVAQTKILEFMALSFPDLLIGTEECIEACKAELKRQIGLLLDGQITPLNFCRFFNSMEVQLVTDSKFLPDEVAFLGDLYNCCDWCDETWTLENSPHLAEESARVASNIDKAKQE